MRKIFTFFFYLRQSIFDYPQKIREIFKATFFCVFYFGLRNNNNNNLIFLGDFLFPFVGFSFDQLFWNCRIVWLTAFGHFFQSVILKMNKILVKISIFATCWKKMRWKCLSNPTSKALTFFLSSVQLEKPSFPNNFLFYSSWKFISTVFC